MRKELPTETLQNFSLSSVIVVTGDTYILTYKVPDTNSYARGKNIITEREHGDPQGSATSTWLHHQQWSMIFHKNAISEILVWKLRLCTWFLGVQSTFPRDLHTCLRTRLVYTPPQRISHNSRNIHTNNSIWKMVNRILVSEATWQVPSCRVSFLELNAHL